MQRRQQKSADDVSIRDHECMQDYVRGGENGDFLVEPQCGMFLQKIRGLQSVTGQHGTSSDEALLMINRSFGYVWRTIPWGKFQDCTDLLTQFVGEERYKIFDPVLYVGVKEERARLMGSETSFAKVFKAAEPKIDKRNLAEVF